MLVALLTLIVVSVLIVVYVVLQSSKKNANKGEKLINRNVPPYETDTAKTGAPDYE